jgi:hypothetical protein
MKRRTACGLLVLLAGCAPDAAEEAIAPIEEEWQVHVAGPEAGEDHPGSVLLTRRAEGTDEGGAFRPRLVLGCEEGVMVAYVEWGTPLGEGEVPVTYRLDEGAEQAAQWRASADGEAAGLWEDRGSTPFIRGLLGRERLAVRVTPGGGGEQAATFALGGLDSLLAQAQRTCGGE